MDQRIKSIFFGQYLANGLKLTLGILVPSLVGAGFDNLQEGLIVSLGAFYVSFPDHPGPVIHRRNGMLAAIVLVFLTVIATGIINQNQWLIAVEIFVFCFLFSMLSVYGARASAVGTAALLMMIASIHIEDQGMSLIKYAMLVSTGGIWYLFLSVSLHQLRPYRQAQQHLGECILEISKYIRLKGDFYDNNSPVQELYNKLIKQQIVINKHQDNVRQIILRTRERVRETMKSGRLVMMIFLDSIELFEQAMSTQQNYTVLQDKFTAHGILPEFRQLIYKIAVEFDDLGYALINNEKPRKLVNFDDDLILLKDKIDALQSEGISVTTLKKNLINIRNITRLLTDMYNYFQTEKLTFLSKTEEADLTKFISRQEFDWNTFKNNLSLRSDFFRHSFRIAISCLSAYLALQWIDLGEHSLWILVTIIVVLKPDYVRSKKRNYERVIGSVLGGLIGALVIWWIPNEMIQLAILIAFMILGFSFNRVRYVIGVIFITALILILFSLISESNSLDLTGRRIGFTIIGSAIAFAASYFVLPNWESSQINTHMSNMLKANLTYFKTIVSGSGNNASTEHKLARKDVLMKTAKLGSAFQRMIDEPLRKQENLSHINEFVVLNHILSSYLASLSSSFEGVQPHEALGAEHLKSIKKTRHLLQEAISHLDQKQYKIELVLPDTPKETTRENTDSRFIQNQLRLIEKVAADIVKLNKDSSFSQGGTN